MATLEEIQQFKDKLDVLGSAIQNSPSYKKMGQGYAPSSDLSTVLKALNDASSRIPGGSATRAELSDDNWARTKAAIQSALTANSDAFRNVIGSDGPSIQLGNSVVNPTEVINELTGTQPSQYVNPNGGGGISPAISQPTTIDQQAQADKARIEAEGQRQYQQQQDFITSDAAKRQAARDQLAQLLTQQAQQSFAQTLPQTAEDYNAGHLLNSSGYGNEVARQQSVLAQQIANQLGQTGLQDVNLQTQQQTSALGGLQGYQTSGLNREFSLQDFQRQADLAKQIGAMSAPQVGNGKGAAGSTLSGIGAVAPYAGFAATGNPMWLGAKSGGGGKGSGDGAPPEGLI